MAASGTARKSGWGIIPGITPGKQLSYDSSQTFEALQQGDQSQEAEFCRHFGPLLEIVFLKRLRSRDYIEDLRQETLLRVLRFFRSGEKLHDPAKVGAFVRQTGLNVLYEHYRRQGKQGSPDLDEVPEGGLNAEGLLLSKERREAVKAVLRQMKDSERVLLESVYWEESDREEICRRKGVSRDHLRVLLHRAVGQFRQLFQEGRY